MEVNKVASKAYLDNLFRLEIATVLKDPVARSILEEGLVLLSCSHLLAKLQEISCCQRTFFCI